ncbi:MAG: ABC transporter permease [Desulfuromonadales bacterium]|nr:ABC transporter permease [Desulfuromonadales bacterium]
MSGFFATFCKELLLIRRDRAGLMLLFIMPAVLVLVVSLVQNNLLETSGTAVPVLLVDEDGGELAKRLTDGLQELGALTLVRQDGDPLDATAAQDAVRGGDYQFAIVIPPGLTEEVRSRARQLAEQSLAGEGAAAEPPLATAELAVYFDPTVQGAFRTAVLSSLRLVVLGLETEEKGKVLAELLPQRIEKLLPALPFGFGTPRPQLSFHWNSEPVLAVREQVALAGGLTKLPTAVQQNVPAWALFGMFFIVIPLSGTLLRERQEGTLQRLRTLPVSPLAILAGKVAAYVLICLGQFGFMLLVGKTVLPLLGTPMLEIGSEPGAIFFLALSAALAATGFGILVGALVGSYEQATMVGSVAVVVAAALGGVMVPVYVMPQAMQAISLFSPLAWGLNGFLDLFVRGGDLISVLPNAFGLLAFFAVTLTLAWIGFLQRNRRGG